LLVIMALSACSSAPKLSDDGRLVRDVDAFVAELGRAYEHRDLTALMDGVATQFPEREALQRTAEAVFDRFDNIDLALTVERVHLEGKTATVYLHWDAQWRAAGGAPIARQGTARFVVETDDRPVLTAVLGDNPFAASPSAPS
jgi:ketosteroid isomerase-like protein